jgi:hypothetical protein
MPEFPGTLKPPRLATAPSSPALGQMYYDTPSNILYWWNGTVWQPSTAPTVAVDPWHLVGGSGEPAFASGWVNYDANFPLCAFRKYPDGRVRLQGMIKSGNIAQTAFTLPVGYRPVDPQTGSGQAIFTAISNSAICDLRIYLDGRVVPQTGSNIWVSLDGVEFDTGQTTWPVGSPGAITQDIWHLIGASGEPAFQNSWVSYDGGVTYALPAFRKYVDGRVKLRGMLKTGAVNTVAFTLPAGYRPAKQEAFPADKDGGGGTVAHARVLIYPNGNVELAGNNVYTSLSGVEFDTDQATMPLGPYSGSAIILSNGANWTGAGTRTNFTVPATGKYLLTWNGTMQGTVQGLAKVAFDFDGGSYPSQCQMFFNTAVLNVHLTIPTVMAVIGPLTAGTHDWRWYSAGGSSAFTNDANDFLFASLVPVGP